MLIGILDFSTFHSSAFVYGVSISRFNNNSNNLVTSPFGSSTYPLWQTPNASTIIYSLMTYTMPLLPKYISNPLITKVFINSTRTSWFGSFHSMSNYVTKPTLLAQASSPSPIFFPFIFSQCVWNDYVWLEWIAIFSHLES
jgi:hypothetical protein